MFCFIAYIGCNKTQGAQAKANVATIADLLPDYDSFKMWMCKWSIREHFFVFNGTFNALFSQKVNTCHLDVISFGQMILSLMTKGKMTITMCCSSVALQ
jgi:hypothetical protein